MRSLIVVSIAFSQIGFVCAGIIFTAKNLLSFRPGGLQRLYTTIHECPDCHTARSAHSPCHDPQHLEIGSCSFTGGRLYTCCANIYLVLRHVHYLHYAFRVDGISTEYNYHGEVPVEEIDLRQDVLIMLGRRLGYNYVMLWRFYQ